MSELYHYGIKGQKWGVRRYQNEDGSYTDEGLKRLNGDSVARRSRRILYDQDMAEKQKSYGKRFDVHTEKMLKDKAAGKKISNRRINKAIKLGSNFRKYDYIAKNPEPYYKHQKVQDVSPFVKGYTGILIDTIKDNTKGGYNKYINDIMEVTKNETIEDLKKHGLM